MKGILQKIKWTDGLLIAGLLMIAVGLGMSINQGREKVEIEKKDELTLQKDVQGNNKVMIDIGGEVMNPGVYELPLGARINDALIVAGGLGSEADREWVEGNLNRAETVKDGMKIVIPKKGETLGITNNQIPITKQTTITNESITKLININTATKEELESLPGIGPSLAQRIIDYREENGGFRDINEIKLVSGIGEKMYEKIKEFIRI